MWEYKVVDVPAEREVIHFNRQKSAEETGEAQMLNDLGMAGWELVGVVAPQRMGKAAIYRLFFKRQRGSQPVG